MRRLMVFAVLLLGASVAQADNGMFYFGVGVTSNNVDDFAPPSAEGETFPAIHSTSFEVFAGIRPIHPLAVEVNYVDLGHGILPANLVFGIPAFKAEAKAFAGYAVGFLPIPLPYLDVYGKAGVARYNYTGADYLDSSFVSYSDNSTVFTWGAGVQAQTGIIGCRLEYAGFQKARTSVFSLSIFLNL